MEPWEWDEATWRGKVDKVRAGRSLKPKTWKNGARCAVALSFENLLFVLLGVVVGMLVGILPGLGPAPTVALLLPLTFGMAGPSAIILLAGVYYGAMYGGTITSVLLKIPGEAASVVSTGDGHAMARAGKAGTALGLALALPERVGPGPYPVLRFGVHLTFPSHRTFQCRCRRDPRQSSQGRSLTTQAAWPAPSPCRRSPAEVRSSHRPCWK